MIVGNGATTVVIKDVAASRILIPHDVGEELLEILSLNNAMIKPLESILDLVTVYLWSPNLVKYLI